MKSKFSANLRYNYALKDLSHFGIPDQKHGFSLRFRTLPSRELNSPELRHGFFSGAKGRCIAQATGLLLSEKASCKVLYILGFFPNRG